jgi:hypothetical protein
MGHEPWVSTHRRQGVSDGKNRTVSVKNRAAYTTNRRHDGVAVNATQVILAVQDLDIH